MAKVSADDALARAQELNKLISQRVRHLDGDHSPLNSFYADPTLRMMRMQKFVQIGFGTGCIYSLGQGDSEPLYGQLAASVSLEDNNIDASEADIIKILVKQKISLNDQSWKPKLQQKTNALIQAIFKAMVKTKRYQDDLLLNRLWQEHAVHDFILYPHIYKRISHEEVVTRTRIKTVAKLRAEDSGSERAVWEGLEGNTENCGLLGDYLLFRADRDGLALPAFYRFYQHETGGVRSMGLRLDEQTHPGFSSKGWAVNQSHGIMVLGYILDRSDENRSPRIDGGASLLFVDETAEMFVGRDHDDILNLAPVIHMQAPHSLRPSCSRGILIRLSGSEKLGGQRDDLDAFDPTSTRRIRDARTRDFQKLLTIKFGHNENSKHDRVLSITTCSRILQECTGISAKFFLPTDMGGMGVFDNNPSNGKQIDNKRGTFSPLEPLGISEPPKGYSTRKGKHPDAEIEFDDISIDFSNPPEPFLDDTVAEKLLASRRRSRKR